MRLQQGEEVLDQGGSVGADDRAGDGEPGQPAVAAEDDADLLPEGDESASQLPVGGAGSYSAPVASIARVAECGVPAP
jgi:hypothetical protein